MSETNDGIVIPRSTIRRLGMVAWGLLALAVIIVILLAAPRVLSRPDPLEAAINANRFQAVYLTGGQLYFGRLTHASGDIYYLDHVYYLQNQTAGKIVHPSLTKLTDQIYTPEDSMAINRSQIVWVENLSPNGRASQLLSGSK